MRKISSPGLSQLLMQLRYTPLEKRRKQLEAAEQLFNIIEKEKEYPFEFVCFRITGFHLKRSDYNELIKGEQLLEDLRVFIAKLSGRIAPLISDQKCKIYSCEELANLISVSTKTLQRWQKYGLLAEKFICQDGLRRLGYRQSMVDEFIQKNPQLIDKAKRFNRLTNKDKKHIISRAAKLSRGIKAPSRHQIIKKICEETGRSHETIRYILANYQKTNPAKVVIKKSTQPIRPAESAELYKQFKQGSKIRQLMEQFNRNKSSIYRIINIKRAKALLSQKIEYIPSDEFFEPDAQEKIPVQPAASTLTHEKTNIDTFKLAEASIKEYLQKINNIGVLSREEELNLFRRYNYLKYSAQQQLTQIKLSQIRGSQLKKIENALAEAEEIKRRIIEANLRLIVSIARKHTGGRAYLPDLVSEGNISLMNAVEKFDYTRGLRFASFAGWAITRDFARSTPSRGSGFDKTIAASLANKQRDLHTEETPDFASIERAGRSLMQVIEHNLDERERYIIIHRFGLTGPPVKKKTKTLMQIGQELGLSKERIRQLELTALQKLRQSLSAKEFELLTG
jgi:RNA polymerase primary sigma factor